ncbi:hypothetical protein AGABI2DRAFT_120033 [Agaricus bisporus var. bisporus H97]|uniref:hypothetical protein n=1 Tax=Agaricus bisporus var. bisporus (strain H97 / ATCC MYA-4626 / FGSC 10389) TaxID=936046 RepID=UPI00029F70C6|nr:hypothetical protein AGABI2DRAFT_120033 [Agaricus bisporus var. bisporus H97]EKV45065.1 hypothetical protein AGABI2DRAFT_120033 [Agaricus bisporus var. bisporus H97]
MARHEESVHEAVRRPFPGHSRVMPVELHAEIELIGPYSISTPLLGANGDVANDAKISQAAQDTKKAARKARQQAPHGDEGAALMDVANVAPAVGLVRHPRDSEEIFETSYEPVAWPLGKRYGRRYDIFKLALTSVWKLFFISFC